MAAASVKCTCPEEAVDDGRVWTGPCEDGQFHCSDCPVVGGELVEGVVPLVPLWDLD